jgi:putative transposase
MCRLLQVSRSGYYAWRDRPTSQREVSNEGLLNVIKGVHELSRGTYGARRVHAELRLEYDLQVSRKRVARLMRLHALVGVHRRGRRRHGLPHVLHQDLVSRQFTLDAPNRVWVADVTQHRTLEGWLYLSVVIDAFGRRVVGWAIDDQLNTELVLSAFRMAQETRRPSPGLIHHSDQGSPFASLRFGRHLASLGVMPSMGRSGTPADDVS